MRGEGIMILDLFRLKTGEVKQENLRRYPRRGQVGKFFFVTLGLFCVFVSAGFAGDRTKGALHAVLINGGQQPSANYLSHLNHIEGMIDVLVRRGVRRDHIHVFSADGNDSAADLAVRDVKPESFWLLEGTSAGKRLGPRTRLTNSELPGVSLKPARKADLFSWFARSGQLLKSGDNLLIFVTDHGTGNKKEPDNGAISLWREKITVREFKQLLGLVPAGVRQVMMMSQCFSGTFANAMYRDDGRAPSGNVCGFYSTTRNLRAYGCYPEGRDRDRIGHAFRMIDALNRHASTDAAHTEVLVTDDSPDVPLRTSDLYLERLVTDAASATGRTLAAFADPLLEAAWRDGAKWESQIRLLDRIGAAFGTFSPRSLAELGSFEAQLSDLSKKMNTYAKRWKVTLVDLKEATLRSFLNAQPAWRAKIGNGAVAKLDDTARAVLLADLLWQLDRHARNQPEIWQRLTRLRDYRERSSRAEWRLKVRSAALLRMRAILLRIAGRVHLASAADTDHIADKAYAALQGLERCEALPAGTPPRGARRIQVATKEPFPPLADELALLRDVLPSWLGVRFRDLSKTRRSQWSLSAGASQIQTVYPKSPAKEAGLAPGDIVIGPPGKPFVSAKQLREWTMTSPRGVALPIRVLRPRDDGDFKGEEIELAIILRPYPLKQPKLPGPIRTGQAAPALSGSLKKVGGGTLPDIKGRAHLLVFWATWCGPCHRAVPELLAYAAAKKLPVLAITDETSPAVESFLERWNEPFFKVPVSDIRRASFRAYGVSGTPTVLEVGEDGKVRYRQTGYSVKRGFRAPDWQWAGH
jgi:thiol-disulfide isomerase/thioredoxin